jgi:hypothetical protein
MTDRSDYFDLIRQLVRGDHVAYKQRSQDLDEKGWDGLGLAVGAAFYQAVQRRFRPGSTQGEVIRFVAEARTDIEGTGYDIDPRTGEALIRAAITGETEVIESFDPRVVVETEMLLLWKLLGPVPDEELDAFFDDADRLAEEWSQEE